MKAWGITSEELEQALQTVNGAGYYDGNLRWKRSPEASGRAFAFTLTVNRSEKRGARRSNTGRRIAAACWHAHRDMFRAIFAINPEARIKSATADYRGVDHFEATFEATGYQNIGSMAQPMQHREACECWQDGNDYNGS